MNSANANSHLYVTVCVRRIGTDLSGHDMDILLKVELFFSSSSESILLGWCLDTRSTNTQQKKGVAGGSLTAKMDEYTPWWLALRWPNTDVSMHYRDEDKTMNRL